PETIGGKPAQVGVENVYEYEPSGVGSCTSPSGCVSLVSAGESEHESAFLDASASGDDVFFVTAQQLAANDTDTTFDAYDAHVCSAASPCITPPSKGGELCAGIESCRSGSPAQQTFGAGGTSTLYGAGNISR